MLSNVQKFYSGKIIFITGGSGFLGKILLSKLLCSCPDIRCIYVLIRENSEKSADLKMEEIFDDPVFASAKQQYPDYETKIKLIFGDCEKEDMGISKSDRTIIENEVDIIFHVAASVNFTSPMKKITYTNVRSLDILLDMANNMKNLKAFVFVSTAFSPGTKTKYYIEEKFYDPPMKPRNLLSVVEHLDDELLEEITPKLTDGFPNRYVYTKHLAEDLCKEKGSALPLCIFRPVIVIQCYKEPLPGWTNNTYGCTGVTFGHAMGTIKVVPVDGNCQACMVPGDYCVNALILSAYHTGLSWEGKTSKLDPPVINYSNCNTKFSVTWENYKIHCDHLLEKYPFSNSVSPPFQKLIKSDVIYRVCIIFLHLIPAMLVDLVLMICGKTPRMKKMYQKIHKFLDLMRPFSRKGWTVISKNIDEVWSTLSDEDKKLFYCDLNELNIEEYLDTMIRGMRLYLAKESEETLQKAVKKRQKFRVFYYSAVAGIILVFLHFFNNGYLKIRTVHKWW